MKHIFMTIFLLMFTISLAVSGEFTFDESAGRVEGKASTPLNDFPVIVTHFEINISDVNEEGERTIVVQIPIEGITTNHERRDSHMFNGVLLKDEFPVITYHAVSDIADPQEGPFILKGRLTIHDVEKPFTIQGEILKEGKRWITEADFTVLLSDYNLSRPGFGPMKVRDEVELSLYLNTILEDN